jgi:hypothetical protein
MPFTPLPFLLSTPSTKTKEINSNFELGHYEVSWVDEFRISEWYPVPLVNITSCFQHKWVGITDIATAMKSSRNPPNPERLNHPDVFGTTRVIDRAMEKNCKTIHTESLCRAFVSHIPGSKHQNKTWSFQFCNSVQTPSSSSGIICLHWSCEKSSSCTQVVELFSLKDLETNQPL